jgi:hypothetical protein
LNKHLNKTGPHRWMPGESGNPAGRPVGARQKIAEALLADLHEVWAEHGKDVLTRLAKDDPGKLASIAYGLLPRDIFINVQQQAPGGLDADAYAALRSLLNVIERCGAIGEPQQVFEMIEEDLRARFAQSVSNPLAIESSCEDKTNPDQ